MPVVVVVLIVLVLVRPILVVAALTAEELAAAGWTLGDVATQVVEAAREHAAPVWCNTSTEHELATSISWVHQVHIAMTE